MYFLYFHDVLISFYDTLFWHEVFLLIWKKRRIQDIKLEPKHFSFFKCPLLHPFQGSGHTGPFPSPLILLQLRNKKNQLFSEFYCSVPYLQGFVSSADSYKLFKEHHGLFSWRDHSNTLSWDPPNTLHYRLHLLWCQEHRLLEVNWLVYFMKQKSWYADNFSFLIVNLIGICSFIWIT